VSIRVVVVDDQDLVRAGLAHILEGEPDLEVVAQSGDGRQALDAVRRTGPDVVLMDIRMPVLDGIAATRSLRADHPEVRVVVLTTFDLDEYVYEALRAGATGFVLKDSPADEIVRAVRVAAAGDALVSPAITRRLIAELARHRPPADRQRLAVLTEREREVLVAMARGLNNIEVGRALFISEGTVRTHVNHLLAKLQVRDRVQAVVLAYETGLVRPGHAGDG
jgi:DNA-binding NarL/FixJ family response regulator